MAEEMVAIKFNLFFNNYFTYFAKKTLKKMLDKAFWLYSNTKEVYYSKNGSILIDLKPKYPIVYIAYYSKNKDVVFSYLVRLINIINTLNKKYVISIWVNYTVSKELYTLLKDNVKCELVINNIVVVKNDK